MAFQQRCFDRMLDFKRQGIAIVLVSHNLQAVSSLCEQSIFLAGQVKAYGPTSEVLNAYVRASQRIEKASASDSITVESVQLITADKEIKSNREIISGTRLTLRIALHTARRLDDVTIGFLIYRSTDQLLVYNGHIPASDFANVDDLSGHFTIDLQFLANLVRGHYYISFHIMHNPTQDFLIYPHQVMTFATYDSRSRAGVADVALSAELVASAHSGAAERLP
jgi:ABC-type glutathione transport system ATPase component